MPTTLSFLYFQTFPLTLTQNLLHLKRIQTKQHLTIKYCYLSYALHIFNLTKIQHKRPTNFKVILRKSTLSHHSPLG